MRSTVLILLLTISYLSFANTIKVNVLTLSTLPLSVNAVSQPVGEGNTLNVTVSKLDDIHLLMQQINHTSKTQHGLMTNDELKQSIGQIVDSHRLAIKNAGLGIGLATALQIQQVPAVVFNKKYVVFGTTDVLAAYQEYQAWLQKHKGVA